MINYELLRLASKKEENTPLKKKTCKKSKNSTQRSISIADFFFFVALFIVISNIQIHCFNIKLLSAPVGIQIALDSSRNVCTFPFNQRYCG